MISKTVTIINTPDGEMVRTTVRLLGIVVYRTSVEYSLVRQFGIQP